MGALSVFFLMGILSTLFLIFVSLFIGILCTYVAGYLFEGFLVSSLLDTKTYRGWIPFYNNIYRNIQEIMCLVLYLLSVHFLY